MGIIKGVQVLVDAAGTNATASGNTDSESFTGAIEGFMFQHHANSPDTTDIVVTDKATGVVILTVTSDANDAYHPVRLPVVDAADANILMSTANGIHITKYMVTDGVNIDLQDANVETNHLIAYVMYTKGT